MAAKDAMVLATIDALGPPHNTVYLCVEGTTRSHASRKCLLGNRIGRNQRLGGDRSLTVEWATLFPPVTNARTKQVYW